MILARSPVRRRADDPDEDRRHRRGGAEEGARASGFTQKGRGTRPGRSAPIQTPRAPSLFALRSLALDVSGSWERAPFAGLPAAAGAVALRPLLARGREGREGHAVVPRGLTGERRADRRPHGSRRFPGGSSFRFASLREVWNARRAQGDGAGLPRLPRHHVGGQPARVGLRARAGERQKQRGENKNLTSENLRTVSVYFCGCASSEGPTPAGRGPGRVLFSLVEFCAA